MTVESVDRPRGLVSGASRLFAARGESRRGGKERKGGREGREAAARSGGGKPSGSVPASVLTPRLILIGCVILLLAIGLIMVYSASSIEAYDKFEDSAYFLKRQLIMIALGVGIAAVVAALPFSIFNGKILWTAWLIMVVLLSSTAVIGHVALGAQRWLELGGLAVQPSELAKIVMMLLCANLIVEFREGGKMSFSQFLVRFAVAAIVPAVLILAQPDLGTTLVALVGILAVLWFGEISRKMVIVILIVVVAVTVVIVTMPGFRSDRIAAWLDPWSDPLDSGYQIINSYYAFSEGGLFGVGLGNSTQKYLYLPYAYNDFIFAVIGEEFGLLGATGVIGIFCVFVYAAFRIGRLSNNTFAKIVTDTSATLIAFQAFLNIACVIGVLPITGKPLPFISYGGTSIVSTMILVGIILSVSIHCNGDAASRRRSSFRVDGGRG